ncbi:RluA family pseudouridine synthase [Halosquirtibacter xylanolyticus]|uniref:RluA family pseudouridine synthase n=1 Tax=Halosquirtibacter xylanolyticus TaxID=3374599 RepID=UPI003749E2D8|nr:RluA family pseudouridine synthase [Prolixibacteraceae bacterium]
MKKKNSDFYNKAKRNDIQFAIQEKETIISFLQKKFTDRSRNSIKQMLHNEVVVVNGEVATKHDHLLNIGDKITITPVKKAKNKRIRGIEILFEDRSLIIINKPAGLSTLPFGNGAKDSVFSILTYYVKGKSRRHEIYNIHRIDKEISGIMVWAKSELIAEQVKEQWKEQPPRRGYVAVVEGKLPNTQGKYSSYLKETPQKTVKSRQDAAFGKQATTNYKVVDQKGAFSLVNFWMDQPFKHQIRAHAKDMNTPILGDKLYGASRNNLKKLALHLGELQMQHPNNNKPIVIDTDIPSDYKKLF